MWSSAGRLRRRSSGRPIPTAMADFADHLDVINLSVGCSIYGSSFELSCERAVDNAALVGVAVAAAAGNNGDGFYNTGSPESSVRALSVGASGVRPRLWLERYDQCAGHDRRRYYASVSGLSAPSCRSRRCRGEPIRRTRAARFSNASEVAGRIVLVDWWDCGLDVKAAKPRRPGAVGVIVCRSRFRTCPLTMPGRWRCRYPGGHGP